MPSDILWTRGILPTKTTSLITWGMKKEFTNVTLVYKDQYQFQAHIITFLISSITCLISVVKKKTSPSIDLFGIEYRFLFSNIYFFSENFFFQTKKKFHKKLFDKKKSYDIKNRNCDKIQKLKLWQLKLK